jgi:hypothetical protein
MAARNWLLAALLGAGLTGSACALILGAEELPQGGGGSGTASSSGTSTGSGPTGSSGAITASGASTSASASSSAGGACPMNLDCSDCAQCMESGPCNLADAGCSTGTTCHTRVACIFQCTPDAGPPGCVTSCGSTAGVTGYSTVHDCICTECAALCTACQ